MSEKVKKIESIKIVLTTELSPPKKLDFQKKSLTNLLVDSLSAKM